MLASKLKEVLKNDDVNITRPSIKAEVRVSGFDDSVTADEIRFTIAEKSGCAEGEIKIGTIRWMYNGLDSVWVQCPLIAANKITEEGKMKIGWIIARTELLPKRPLQCYRCWAFGYVKFSCTSQIDRTKTCYYCGVEGHSARNCLTDTE